MVDFLFSQPFTRFVQCGRVAFINDGPYVGKLCVIVDVIDQTRVSDLDPYYFDKFLSKISSSEFNVLAFCI